MLGQFTGEKQTNSGLDLSAGDGGSFVVVSQSGGLSGDSLEDIVDEAVHNGHGLAGYTSVGVHLFQDFVDVDCVGFFPLLPSLLVPNALALALEAAFLLLCLLRLLLAVA